MTERPILFSAPMVKAILEGRKTQTRRVLNPQPNFFNGGQPMNNGRGSYSIVGGWKRYPFAPGDVLWVREEFSGPYAVTGRPPREWSTVDPIWYWADGNPADGDWTKPKPPIHMPRWASRITLRVTAVKVERLQSISEEDAKAEGIRETLGGWWSAVENYPPLAANSPVGGFYCLWAFINSPASWEANPWVCAVSFERVKP